MDTRKSQKSFKVIKKNGLMTPNINSIREFSFGKCFLKKHTFLGLTKSTMSLYFLRFSYCYVFKIYSNNHLKHLKIFKN